MHIFLQEGFAEGDQADLFQIIPFEGFVMSGVGKIDGSRFGGEDLVIGGIFPGSVLHKDKGIKVSPVYRGFVGQRVMNVFQVVDGELGLGIDGIDGQSEIDVLLVQRVKSQDFFFGYHWKGDWPPKIII